MDWEQAKARLLEEPELHESYRDSEPAYLVAREVLRARAEMGISQAELARRMGTSQSVISRLENLDGSPNLRTVIALARALDREVSLRFVDRGATITDGTPPDWVLGDREEFIEGITRLVTEQVMRSTEMIREGGSTTEPGGALRSRPIAREA
jgi:transcriptional regulator with XRE-family HTH domain